jgi:hypothetical protein
VGLRQVFADAGFEEVSRVIGLVHHLPLRRCVERRRTDVVDGAGRTVW